MLFDIGLIPQLKRCGLIEAKLSWTRKLSTRRIPQLKRCGLIEAGALADGAPRFREIPQLKRCGLIEASACLRRNAGSSHDSAAETLRPH